MSRSFKFNKTSKGNERFNFSKNINSLDFASSKNPVMVVNVPCDYKISRVLGGKRYLISLSGKKLNSALEKTLNNAVSQ